MRPASGSSGTEPPAALAALLAALVTSQRVFFPVRHHSPACARHARRLILERRPAAVLVEGPSAFTRLLPLLLDARTRPPVALYTSAGEGEARRAGWYPFCAYSPEWVALQSGRAVGAELRFIDLDFAAQCAHEDAAEEPAVRTRSLADEVRLSGSARLRALAARTGCRNHNDLWDHLFESQLLREDSAAFAREVAAWCWLARQDYTPADLAADGTFARELAMAEAIRAVEAEFPGRPVFVLTGGFHSVALPGLLAAGPGVQERATPPPPDDRACLVRYSFAQLDALNGYHSGMPAPAYFEAVWRAVESGRDPWRELAATTLVELGQATRTSRSTQSVTVADEIAALEQAEQLAALRGHPGPLREDIFDGVRSAFLKGEADVEGNHLLGWLHEHFRGGEVGDVPPEAGAPPLLEDFRRQAARLRLDLSVSLRRRSELELYRKARHRELSRFFHRVRFLEAPFGICLAGPDFLHGTGLDRLVEAWEWQWTPLTDARLVEAAVEGDTLEIACTARLQRQAAALGRHGPDARAPGAVKLLVQACRLGLQSAAGELPGLIGQALGAEPEFPPVVECLVTLGQLWRAREPLEARRVAGLPGLIDLAGQRALYLAQDLWRVGEAAAPAALEALLTLFAVAREPQEEWLDAEALGGCLLRLARDSRLVALLQGGCVGLAWALGRLPLEELVRRAEGALLLAPDQAASALAFLTGLLETARELAWREPRLLAAIDALLHGWDEDEFISRLPHLRLAFAALSPRETDQVAAAVAAHHGVGDLPRPLLPAGSEQELLLALRTQQHALEALRRDGLEAWIPT